MAMLPNSKAMLAILVGQVQPGPLILRFYANEHTPMTDDEVKDYEVLGNGRYAVELDPHGWTITSGPPAVAIHNEVSVQFLGAEGEAYGYYVTAGEQLLWAERFEGGAYPIRNNGDEIRITPALALGGG